MNDLKEKGRVAATIPDAQFRDFVPTEGRKLQEEWALLRNALASFDSAAKRIKTMGHSPTTARERFAILDQAMRDGAK